MSQNIVNVEEYHLVRWWNVSILIVKENGSIENAYHRKFFLRNGFAKIVVNYDRG
jgi:hypothetical protein